jgi:hypothetical protein
MTISVSSGTRVRAETANRKGYQDRMRVRKQESVTNGTTCRAKSLARHRIERQPIQPPITVTRNQVFAGDAETG